VLAWHKNKSDTQRHKRWETLRASNQAIIEKTIPSRITDISHLSAEQLKAYRLEKQRVYWQHGSDKISKETCLQLLSEIDAKYNVNAKHVAIGRKGHKENQKLNGAQRQAFKLWFETTLPRPSTKSAIKYIKDTWNEDYSAGGFSALKEGLGIRSLHSLGKENALARRALRKRLRDEKRRKLDGATERLNKFNLDTFIHAYEQCS
jgi:hypothetical protein